MQQLSLKPFIILFVASALVACTNPISSNDKWIKVNSGTPAIIGGTVVTNDDPASKTTVAIVTIIKSVAVGDESGQSPGLPKIKQSICTGTLIAENIVLTAAHCVRAAKPGVEVTSFIVFSKDLNQLDESDLREVVQVLPHPEFGQPRARRNSPANDLALMKFQGVKPEGYGFATVLTDESVLTRGQIVTLAGFGQNDGVTKQNDKLLRQVDVEVHQELNSTEMVLDQSHQKGACQGDSGGPASVVIDGISYIWGVASRSVGEDGADDCSLYSIYTKIYSHRDFINEGLQYLKE